VITDGKFSRIDGLNHLPFTFIAFSHGARAAGASARRGSPTRIRAQRTPTCNPATVAHGPQIQARVKEAEKPFATPLLR
jgi:hypothetical protein